MISRDDALALLKEHLKEETHIFHSLESEAVMRALARRLSEDEEAWGLAGLLHDVDFGQTGDAPERHGLVARDILEPHDVPEEVVDAIMAHNGDNNGTPIHKPFHHALRCAETITGLVSAAALVQPDKKLASVKPKSVRKKYKDKAFARKVNRETIRECEELGLELPEFIELAVRAMQEIGPRVGL